ncbi:di-heme-cytochrome C peroxidase [Pseudoalteromonas sp. T1lg76]|uniref:di-heme-cytochrome C peroxidase n=1 Tax=Pseudoalteromonas sp. T1lg76 TaxID=2077103 RepID=UPI000CF6D7CD|nr:di-heme-cytochrome C peroxidase [Pseudoalteromonas sp. T1lg76]
MTFIKITKRILVYVTGVIVLAGLSLFALVHYPASQIPDYVPTEETRYLDQGWGLEAHSPERQTYYYTPQGTSLKGIEYDWLAHLEMPWGETRFAEPGHLKAYGFIVDDTPSPENPYQYPLGFTKHFDQASASELLDLSCAACHNGQLNYKKDGKHYALRIDGGQAMHAFTTMKLGHFVPTLVASMTSTYLNPLKFDRFATQVLGEQYNDHNKAVLRKKFGKVLMRFLTQGFNDTSKGLYPVTEGFGRTDALARIGNTVFGDNLAAENYHKATGPVNYPPLWNIWKFNWVQYGASVKQPMARNMGEALGVGAHIALTDSYGNPLPPEQRFDSSVLPEQIFTIETTLQKLTPPQWPEDIFGPVDRVKAAEGQHLFQRHCAGCHGPHPASDLVKQIETPLKGKDQPLWIMSELAVNEVGTDPNAAYNFLNYRFDLSKTGLTNSEIVQKVRAMNIRQLQRLAKVLLNSPRLEQFLQQPEPQAEALTLTTNWISDHPQQYQDIEQRFNNWQNKYAKLAGLDQLIAEQGDNDVQQDIKTALIQQQLRSLDDALAKLSVETLSLGEALNITGIYLREKYYQDKNFSPEKQACMDGFGALDLPQQKMIYKTRPLEGIWATPPFLHNGSVPNIYQLLSPVSERDSQFWVGQREYDPVHLGYVTEKEAGHAFLFDTQKDGNKNIGHEFRDGYIPYQPGNPPQYGVIGPALAPAQRLAIIEYLKIHKDSPESTHANANASGLSPSTQCEGL